MKKILGLDLGTNSIGWALVDKDSQKILGMGSRIIPMGTDKQDYEKGIGITRNADRRTKRTIRKMNKRYKLRRNKLLYILHELGMLPEQFQFKNGIPEPTKLQDLELLPIVRKREYDEKGRRKDRIYKDDKRVELDPNSILNYRLRVKALEAIIELKDLGKILYQYNQLRGYSGGNSDDDVKKKGEENVDDEETAKKYNVFTQKVTISKVEKSDVKFKVRGGPNKGQELHKFNVTIILDDEDIKGETELQHLEDKVGREEEFEIRIKRNKRNELTSIVFASPQKTNWRKQMEATEEVLKDKKMFVSQFFLEHLEQNKWKKIRNRVILRNRYQEEFDRIWEMQSKKYTFLNDCPKETLEKIACYIFPGKSESQEKLRKKAVDGGLRHIVRNQIIYYQRPLKSQIDLISKCQFEKEETVLASSHPLFQEFRCWDQINRMYITSKQEVWNEKKNKNVFLYSNRFLTNEEKQEIYNKLRIQKQLGFSEVARIVKLKSDKVEYLNGLNVKAKLKGCDTAIAIRGILNGHFEELYSQDNDIVLKLWRAIFENSNNGNEYDPKSLKVSSVTEILKPLNNDGLAVELALKFVQKIKFPREYASLSERAIKNILPLMQLNPSNVPDRVKKTFDLIQTGQIADDFPIEQLEDYVASFVEQNPNAIRTGGLMYAFASSLVYGRHTRERIKPQIKDYHEIQYVERNLRNPVVSQLANETMQIVKALWKQYKLDPRELEIRVELARDLKNSAEERDKIYKGQIRSQKINETIKRRLIELKQEPTQGNIELYKLWSKQNIYDYPAPQKANEPTQEEIQKLRLWEQQHCISPYTLNPIPLSKLFSPERLYDIDHIVPKSRYFDDSLSNKVVCESDINEEKGNRTAWEYISQQNSAFGILSEADYIKHVNEIFYGKKKKNLLLEKIPTNPVERLIKDTQYISVAVKNELAKIVGSDNVKTSTGEVTSFLRSQWGLKKMFMELTEERFKQMELWDINAETGKPNTKWIEKFYDKEKRKHIYEIKNWSKRYDNRHHAIDALVVALTEQRHIQRLNNLNKYLQDELMKRKDDFKLEIKEGENILEVFFNLEAGKRDEIQKGIESSRLFEKPLEDLVRQAKDCLEATIVSIKPKDKLKVNSDKYDSNTPHKQLKSQIKIRAALHQETNYGKSKDPKTGFLRDTKTVSLSMLSAKDIPNIIDKVLRDIEVPNHRSKYESTKEAFTGEGLKAFNGGRFQRKEPGKLKPPVYKVKVWYSGKGDDESTLQRLYNGNEKLSVLTGDNYLFLVMEKQGKRIFDIASLYDSVDIAKRTLVEKDGDFRAKICEDYMIKHKDKPNKVLFTLQQGDLVYFPATADDQVLKFNNKELGDWLSNIENKKAFSRRVYRVVMFTGKDCKFIPHYYANAISVPKELTDEQMKILKKKYEGKRIPKNELNFVEFGSYRDSSPYEMSENLVKNLTETRGRKKQKLVKIQECCVKIEIDWLGNIKLK